MATEHIDRLEDFTKSSYNRFLAILYIVLLLTLFFYFRIVTWHWGWDSALLDSSETGRAVIPTAIATSDSLLKLPPELIPYNFQQYIGPLSSDGFRSAVAERMETCSTRLQLAEDRWETIMHRQIFDDDSVPLFGIQLRKLDLPFVALIILPVVLFLLLIATRRLLHALYAWQEYFNKKKDDKDALSILSLRLHPLSYHEKDIFNLNPSHKASIWIIGSLLFILTFGSLGCFMISDILDFNGLRSSLRFDDALKQLTTDTLSNRFLIRIIGTSIISFLVMLQVVGVASILCQVVDKSREIWKTVY